ncbi:MAG TPA: hypothetical protein VMU34_09325 [Mycobacterium sp.]|nr:hypothetical protein [Mycobacterium sp.]
MDAIIFSRGSRSITAQVNGVRSRITNEVVRIGQMVVENGDVGAGGHGGPVGHPKATF